MEVQDLYQNQAQKLFDRHHPPPQDLSELNRFLTSEGKKNKQNILDFVVSLVHIQPTLINFDAFCRIIRIVKRAVISSKNQEAKRLLANFVATNAKLYFPYLRHVRPHQFQELLTILKGLPITEPQDTTQHLTILLALSQPQHSQQFVNLVVDLINNEVLIEKKSQSFKNIKLNQFFSPFIIKHIDRFIPQLQRLLVRNQSNVEVWEDFITTIKNWQGIDAFVFEIISKIKKTYLTQPQISVKIVSTLTNNLIDEKVIKTVIDFISALISGQHNGKRKIVYVRMLTGVINSLKTLKDQSARNILAQEISVILSISLNKFTEEEQFNILVSIIDSLCPLITDPKDDIAKALKLYIKNTNKYILILLGLFLSGIYKQEHHQLPSVKQIYNHFKTQLPTIVKKAETNWQWLMPILNFMTEIQSGLIDNLSSDLPIFKASCLALSIPEMKVALHLIIKKIKHIKAEDQEVDDYIYAVSTLLLEEIHDEKVWKEFLQKLAPLEKAHLISRGIFPVKMFPCDDFKKNKNNNFQSLLLFLKKHLKNQKIQIASAQDFMKLVVCFGGNSKFVNSAFVLQADKDFTKILEKYVRSSLFDWQKDEDSTISSKEKQFIDTVTKALLIYRQDYLYQLLQLFSKQQFYKKDLQFLVDLQAEVLSALNLIKNEILQYRQLLVQRQIHQYKEPKPRKIYLGATFDIKMMSEQQVKQQKYKEHFLKMVRLFDLISEYFLSSCNDHLLLTHFWQKLMNPLLNITIHAEHRLSIYKLVKRSCLYTFWFNHQHKQSKIFLKHSQFLGQFFSQRNSGLTPSVKLMNHCEVFLKELLLLPLEAKDTHFPMLQDQQSQFIGLFVNQMCVYLLQNMEFDVNLKKLAIKFYDKCFKKGMEFGNEDIVFTFVGNNINIMSNSDVIQPVLLHLLKKIPSKRYKQLFADILNFIQTTKKLILETLSMLDVRYQPQFEQFIKLKILSLESNQDISKLATLALNTEIQIKSSILTFNMKNFVEKNSKQTIEKLCLFIKQEITPQTAEPIFHMVLKASQELFDDDFDQQGLEMLPYFLTINIDSITEHLFKPVFNLLTTKFTSKEQYGTLTKLCVEIGINIIKKNAKQYAQKLLLVLQGFINKASGVSNIIFLGVLAPYLEGNKNLQIIQQRITQLFKGDRQNDQKSISKCMPDLMSFFKNPQQIIDQIFINIGTMKESVQIGQAYLFSGLLKGVGYKQTQTYLQKLISSDYVTKTRGEKVGRIFLIHAMIENFGRVVETNSIQIISIILGFMADNLEEIRNMAKKTGQNLILKMSSYSVKILLPQLLKGLQEQQNWRVKISYIWILGVMANCSAKQLQTSLPIIVPSLSACLSNAHPTIRQKSSEALNLIGQTIKNPQISQCVDILIEALEDPFEKSSKAIDLLLKTNFNHYIDPPSLSMIIPILDYCLRGRSSELKAGACQVMGSIVELIFNPNDLLPYLTFILVGLKVALCDPLPQIRRIASMAIGKISAKIGIEEAEEYFRFVSGIIQSSTSNSIQRQGAAQAHAEIICSQTIEYFEQSLFRIFDKLNSVKHAQKQGYILVFLFVPMIRTHQFQGFIKEVNQNMYSFVSDEEQVVRNAAMLVEKVLITNYCLSHTDLLLEPLCDGAFDNNWKKRNAAIILIGQMLNIIKSYMYNTKKSDKTYAYYRGLMAVYVIKDDDLEMSRMTAIQVWNTYIENTPKTIRSGIEELVKMWTKWTHATGGVVFKNIVAFSTKYGENYFTEIMDQLPLYLDKPEHQVGVFEVLAQFIKRMNKQFLSRQIYRQTISGLFADNLFVISQRVRPALAKCLAIYVDKMQQQSFFQELLYPTITKMDETDQSSSDYTYNLHLIKDLLYTNSHKVVDRVISKIMAPPMSEFKIQVITNNAEKLANYLYSHFKRPATQLLVEEILSLVGVKGKQNRLSLIVYCLQQVSLKLNAKNKEEFIKMVNHTITKRIQIFKDSPSETNRKILEMFVNMVLFFLNSTPLADIDDLEIILGQISPLIFLDSDQLSALGHRIFMLVISDPKAIRTSEYIRQIRVSFENNNKMDSKPIWQNQNILKDYISIIVKGIAYGREEVMEESLDMLNFMLTHTPRSLIDKYILRLVGPVIRISNYPLLPRQKIRIIELLISVISQNFNIAPYNNQILSVCNRLLQEFKSNDQVIEIVAEVYQTLIQKTVLKKEIILSIISKLKSTTGALMQTVYYLIKNIIKKELQFPKTLFEKVHEEITTNLLGNSDKSTVKNIYYASKTSARIGVFLDKPISTIEKQLKGLTVPYEVILNYLHFSYYKKTRIPRLQCIQIFVKESNRQKVYYLLKSLHLCCKYSQQTKKTYSAEYIKKLVPENITGFEEIAQMMDEFESEIKVPDIEADVNQA